MSGSTSGGDFNSLGTIWQTTYPWAPNGYTGGDQASWLPNPSDLPADAQTIGFNNGILTLTDMPAPADVSPDEIGGMSRIGAQVLTEGTFAQTYGYFQATIEMPAGAGTMGAFWLMPANGSWPPELDVAEMIGSDTTTLVNTVHDASAPPPHWTDVPDMSAGFHTYAVDWEPNQITWYFDGQETFSTPTPSDMNTPMYMILSTTSGQASSWEGQADSSTTSQMQVSDVKVYSANPANGGTLTYETGSGDSSSSTSNQGSSTPEVTTSASQGTSSNQDTSSNQGTSTSSALNTVTVNSGNSTVTAPSGPAMFVFNGSDYHTSIKDFSPGIDTIDFEGTSDNYSNITITAGRSGSAIISLDGDHIRLPGVTPGQLSQSNFTFNAQSSGNS